jgi:hypothetical protein
MQSQKIALVLRKRTPNAFIVCEASVFNLLKMREG